MKFSALSRTGFAVALTAVLASMAAPAMAEIQNSNIFSQVAPSFRDRLFFRLNYIRANVKTSSGEAYDVTGPIIAKGEIRSRLGVTGGDSGGHAPGGVFRTQGDALDLALKNDAADSTLNCPTVAVGVGTPCGVRATSQTMAGTPAVSVGYYFDDELSWAVEAYILAVPLNISVYGQGPNHLNNQKIIETKLLPPIVVFGKYFGTKENTIRPFVGFGGSYAFFYDAKATDTLNQYVGGSSAGDTTVHINNTSGFGPFLGLKADLIDGWHLSFNIGKLKYKTDATITTNNTKFTDSSLVLQDLGPNVRQAVDAATYLPALNGGSSTGSNGVTNLMCDLAFAKNGNSNCNMGTYVRKQSTAMDATMFMIAVGRSF